MRSFTSFATLAVLCAHGVNAQNSPSDAEQVFTDLDVVPDVIPSFDPVAALDIAFPQEFPSDPGSANVSVTPGMNLTMEQTMFPPIFSLELDDDSSIGNDSFVILLVDPDAPTPQNATEADFRHFVGANFFLGESSNVPGSLLFNTTPAITEFVPPTPPAGSDPHRYVVLVYVQPMDFLNTSAAILNDTTPRNNFNLTEFTAETGLTDLVAGSVFLVVPDNTTSVVQD